MKAALPAVLALVLFGSDAALAHQQVFHLNERIEKDIGYAQAVRVGDTLYVSGSVGEGKMPDAIHQAYEALKATLAAHKLDFSSVVKENVYTTDIDAFVLNKALRKDYYGENTPAATWVQVQRLYSPEHVLEVELVAVFPTARKTKLRR